jgi:signal transduction histidine kinase
MNERLAAIGQMVTGLAHESRNAFQRSHACLSELALDLEGRPQSLELVRKVQKALDDLHFLLEEVRNYSAPIILERRECDLVSIIQDTWQAILDAKPNSQSPKLTIDSDPNFPDSVYIDDNRIQMVMRNLLENAAFASPPQGDVSVRLTNLQIGPHPLRIEVTDQGGGIAPGTHEKIFAPFYTTKTKGTGLGLAITRRYIDSHNGRIFADPDLKAGARFIIELPNSARKSK